MLLYSQHDPAYDRLTLGPSPLTVHSDGCFLCSIATLYQRPVTELLGVQGAFTATGALVSEVLAQHCGGDAQAPTIDHLQGWMIAQTDHYAPHYPTHFFCINLDTKQMIDPLDFPAVVKPNDGTYHIVNFRPFTNTKLDLSQQPTVGPFPDVSPTDPDIAAVTWAKDRGIMHGGADGLFHPDQPITRRQLAIVLQRMAA